MESRVRPLLRPYLSLCIIIPQTDELPYDVATLGQMVREVNGSEVRPEEVLSDHPYVYLKEQKTLCYEKDGQTINMKFSKDHESNKKESIKSKLVEGSKKSKALEAGTKPKKEKAACLE